MSDPNSSPNSQSLITASQNITAIATKRNQILLEYESEIKLYLKKYGDDMAKCDLAEQKLFKDLDEFQIYIEEYKAYVEHKLKFFREKIETFSKGL